VLREAAAHDDALKIADAGLGLAAEDDLAGSVVPLAHWLRDYLGGMAAPPLKPEPPQPEGSVADHRRSVCIGSRAEVSNLVAGLPLKQCTAAQLEATESSPSTSKFESDLPG